MRFDEADVSFVDEARAWIATVDETLLVDAQRLFRASPGYYPTLLAGLRREEIRRRGLRPAPVAGEPARSPAALPVGHPGDYEWRFTEPAARALLSTAAGSAGHGEAIMHVGAPTTFALGGQSFPEYRHVLIERNVSLINVLMSQKRPEDEIIRVDLGAEPVRRLNVAAAIVDPPWYLGDTLDFLYAISDACADGASILLCQPTVATRPRVNEERLTLLNGLTDLGLEHTGTRAAYVRYLTPHFEAMSLAAAMRSVFIPPDWRKGDVLSLRKTAPCARKVTSVGEVFRWREARFGPVRIKLRASGADDLDPIVPGDVLDTVSRRDPNRARIGFWTSGNRVFGLANPAPIENLIRVCHGDFMASRFSYERTLDHARRLLIPDGTARKVFNVLLIELQEHVRRGETSW